MLLCMQRLPRVVTVGVEQARTSSTPGFAGACSFAQSAVAQMNAPLVRVYLCRVPCSAQPDPARF